MARLIWRIINITFGPQKSNNVIHMFGTWFQAIRWKEQDLILTCVSAVCWAMWLSKNDIIFDKVNPQPCLQILFRATHWIRLLESMAMEIFVKNGWRFNNKLFL